MKITNLNFIGILRLEINMENLNFYVKRAFYVKVFELIAIIIVLVSSILLDLGLFLEYKNLNVLMAEYQAVELSNTRDEKYLTEIETYGEMYNFLDKEHIKMQLIEISDTNYETVFIDESGTFVTTNLSDIDHLDEYTRKLDSKESKFDIKSITSEGKSIYVEMKVS